MLPLVMVALGIITDRNSTGYWYQSKALPAQAVCLSLTASFHTLSLQNRWDPYQALWLLVCNRDLHLFLMSEADFKGILSRSRETVFQE